MIYIDWTEEGPDSPWRTSYRAHCRDCRWAGEWEHEKVRAEIAADSHQVYRHTRGHLSAGPYPLQELWGGTLGPEPRS